ncbi:FAD-dependent oxidoreductase [Streptomyces sp. AC555_RSS877]|uniref:FAD-dependent oxidoreductase n=1 Tax=Streptomyces sp. AC555_RSS877 TaxID=2823688 RepID=UPI001C27E4A1|nr:FAD-dependent oxidoreductase [Streptomyces sp. AC555_RSS877]
MVVGAGIVGSPIAYHLARRGASVPLVDPGPAPATGVTGESFAWIGGPGGDLAGRRARSAGVRPGRPPAPRRRTAGRRRAPDRFAGPAAFLGRHFAG